MRRHRPLSFGAEILSEGVQFRLWAPDAEVVFLTFADGRQFPMMMGPDGWFELTTAEAGAGTRYRYRIGDAFYPDPASRSQPDDALAVSAVVDPNAYDWRDGGWQGVPWAEAVIYELHPGTFSEAGDFAGIAQHLDHLLALGVTLIELMPVAECPGRWNWGYDGVLPFAPAQRYGGPEAMKRLVDECHQRGIGVILDVVYNHFGPAGNFLHAYASRFFTDKHHTPWGSAINFDDVGAANVRRFFIENALYWLDEFHLDGLRFDAVHAIEDTSTQPILEELGETIRTELPGRLIHLILENDRNQSSLLGNGVGGPGPYDAQWNDDFHHALRVALTGAAGGYYDDYARDPVARVGRALAEGFVYQGEASPHRDGRPRGEPSADLPPSAFVNFIQNHDQVGNHAYGWRLPHFADRASLRAAAAILLLSPAVPMLFMGEEWATDRPFPFFCDFDGDLAGAVRKGRAKEFAGFAEFRDEAARARIPDPLAEATFLSAKLDWPALDEPAHAEMLAFYRQLLALRRKHIAPLLAHSDRPQGQFVRLGAGGLEVRWRLDGAELTLLANLSDEPLAATQRPGRGELIYRSHEAVENLPPRFVSVTLQGAAQS
ncbi:MAG TPA: malto-oligosyltrehalose trehalohydrolase [Aliidongia sp.]|uniref:malto-oligosyltrehalose trehalohydrolase n=1 Tax=Aliidongia sp. TaxID=1914230 RepID=UPI002DDD267D|nr:malto-oligosyltrehalose trehalohydrolase [Aliidongia sp.]HEV2675622.1 malto-oligosyltrehalose trehalohydrolase [Aliidongia sp.]